MTTEVRYASEGAASQGGDRPIRDCNKCGAEIVLVQSNKSGKWYPVGVNGGRSGMAFYVKSNIHECGVVLLKQELEDLYYAHKARFAELRELEDAAFRAGDEELERTYHAAIKKLAADHEDAVAAIEAKIQEAK